MCLIVYNPSGINLDKTLMQIAYDNNPHGFGIVWLNDNNELSTFKDIIDFKTFWVLLGYLKGYTYAFHLRWKTRGEINSEQCHPFQILNKDKHGHDLYMMHNGTISQLKHEDKSDSQIFSEILTKTYEKQFFDKDLIEFYNFIDGGKSTIGSFNRLLFLTKNSVKIINKCDGVTYNDVWYSNYYSFIKDYRKNKNNQIKISIIEETE